MIYDLLIVGSGAAGFSAAIYAGRYLIKTALIKGHEWGGETANAATIENYPGYLAVEGFELMQKMEEQAKNVGVEMKDGLVTELTRNDKGYFIVSVGEEKIQARAVVLATGSRRRRLNIPKEKELTGKGISYCTTCDAPLYKGKLVAIVGGGDAAVKGAQHAADYAQKIILLVRGKALKAEPANIEKMNARENIEVLYETEIKELVGTDYLEKIILTKSYHGSNELIVEGLFVEAGAEPNSALAQNLGATVDKLGYIEVDPMMKTNIEGLFAAGDVVNETDGFKQDIVAAAQGSIAAASVYKYLNT